MDLGFLGAWRFHFHLRSTPDAMARLRKPDRLGIPACWVPERPGRDALTFAALAPAETRELRVATGIANLWLGDPETMAAGQRTPWDRFPGRFLLGLGVSHRNVVERQRHDSGRPLLP